MSEPIQISEEAREAALLAVAESANELIQFDCVERGHMRTKMVSALADLTESGWKPGAKWPPLPEIKPIATVLNAIEL